MIEYKWIHDFGGHHEVFRYARHNSVARNYFGNSIVGKIQDHRMKYGGGGLYNLVFTEFHRIYTKIAVIRQTKWPSEGYYRAQIMCKFSL